MGGMILSDIRNNLGNQIFDAIKIENDSCRDDHTIKGVSRIFEGRDMIVWKGVISQFRPCEDILMANSIAYSMMFV